MTQDKMTIQDCFQALRELLFPDSDPAVVVGMSDDEQRTFMLEAVERLFAQRLTEKIEYFIDLFAAGAEYNPLVNPAKREQMNDDERILCAFYVSMSALCGSLYRYESFDPLTLGIDAPEDFFVDNESLVEYMRQTPYVTIASLMAETMRRLAIALMQDVHYEPAQDYLCELWLKKSGCLCGRPLDKDVDPKEYITLVLDSLQAVDDHIVDGNQRGLREDEIYLHDEIFGCFMNRYEETVLPAVYELFEYMDKHMRVDLTGYNPERPWCDQPDRLLKDAAVALKAFAEKLRAVRDNDFAAGWLADDSLAFEYVMAHARRRLVGVWRMDERTE